MTRFEGLPKGQGYRYCDALLKRWLRMEKMPGKLAFAEEYEGWKEELMERLRKEVAEEDAHTKRVEDDGAVPSSDEEEAVPAAVDCADFPGIRAAFAAAETGAVAGDAAGKK